jgi:FkbM family methyltransferase
MANLDSVRVADRLAERLAAAGVDVVVHVVEAGARKPAGQEQSAEPFYGLRHARILAVEAEEAEARRLAAELACDTRITVAPVALARRDGTAQLVITRKPNCSSLYPPNPAMIARYPGLAAMTPDRAVEIATRSVRSVLGELGWPRVDLMKLDVQGAELDIIAGAEAMMATTLAIVTEVSFQEIYSGQPEFGDVARVLADNGLEFYRFVHFGGMARRSTRHDQGQQLFADALFVRTPELVPAEMCARLAVVATLYGMLDVAEVALERVGQPEVLRWYRETIASRAPWTIERIALRLRRAMLRVRESWT